MPRAKRHLVRRTLAEYEEQIRQAATEGGLTARDVTGLVTACEQALASDVPFARVGAAVMCHGTVISAGHNSLKTDPTQRRWNRYRDFVYESASDPANMDSMHAEMAALKVIPWPVARRLKWSQVRVYVFRIAPGLRLGQGMARPCPACWKALEHRGVRHVAYSTDEGFAKEVIPGDG